MIRANTLRFFMILTFFLLSGCKSELISNVTERQANEVIALLQENNIDASKLKGEKGVFSVNVEQAYMNRAIELLNTYNLPSSEKVEIAQQFPVDAMVSTPLGEKARLISAIEQRLGQSMLLLENVTSAKVHLSYPIEDDSDEPSNPRTASVLIIYENTIDEAEYTEKIKRLVKNSMNDINYENISVVLFKRKTAMDVSTTHSFFDDKPFSYLVLLLAFLIAILSISFLLYKKEAIMSKFKR